MPAGLNAAVKEISVHGGCRIVTVRGAGDTFCARGDDVKEFNNWEPTDFIAVTIAAVDGVCTGGGLELTLVCDFVIATNRSRWGMPEINVDIIPGWGGTAKIATFARRRKAKEWDLIGRLDLHAKRSASSR